MKKIYSCYMLDIYQLVNRPFSEEILGRLKHILTDLTTKLLHTSYKFPYSTAES